MLILGVESSCDETGIALYDSAAGLLSHALHSQVAMHAEYGGVVPELASRDHIRRVVPLLREALERAGKSLSDIDAVAYTRGPGLAGALLVGCAAVSVAVALTDQKLALYALSFLTGLGVQSFKICVDTIVQAHVDERFKGRAFTFYDMGFNGAFVLAGVVAGLLLPPHGLSAGVFAGIAVTYAACWLVLRWGVRRLGAATFEKGTEDLTGAGSPPAR